MPARIRLQRQGKKGNPFYHLVIADGRAPRDGRFIEKIGAYNPVTNPATIELDFDKALDWVQKGAQPSDTAKAILSYKGVMYKNHLLKGVKKGALTEEQAEQKFQAWLKDKELKIQSKVDSLKKKEDDVAKEKMAAETKVKEEREKTLLAKKLELEKAEESEAAEEEDGEATEAATDQTEAKAEETSEVKAEEAPAAEEPKTEEAPVEEAKEEKPAEEAKEEPKAEETPAVDAKAEETAEKKAEEPKAE